MFQRPKRKKTRMSRIGKAAPVHLNQQSSFLESLQGVIKTSRQLQPRSLIKNHIPLSKNFLTHNMLISTSTSLANESPVQDPAIGCKKIADGKIKRFVLPDLLKLVSHGFALIAYGLNGFINVGEREEFSLPSPQLKNMLLCTANQKCYGHRNVVGIV